MPLTNRAGSAVALGSVSSRVKVTLPAAASAFFDMKTRPVVVATHNVPVSFVVRANAATLPPAREVPRKSGVGLALPVRLVAPLGPIRTTSPHAGSATEVVNSGQFASRNAWLPAQSRVRQTLNDPW